MTELIKSFIVGAICGAVFTFCGLPIPAPGVLAGVIGIVGVFVGYTIINFFK